MIHTTVSCEMTRFIIALGLDGPRADKSRYVTPHRGMRNYSALDLCRSLTNKKKEIIEMKTHNGVMFHWNRWSLAQF